MADSFKNALRNTMKILRSKVTDAYHVQASQLICNRIRTLEHYRQAKHIALYAAINNEIDLTYLWYTAPTHKKLWYFPIINNDLTLSFLPVTSHTTFKKNRYGILEPDVSLDLIRPVEEIDLIITPVVAFDTRCTRLGMGAGYYDRTLNHNPKCFRLGVAYQFQHMDFIAPEPWDIPLDAVLTQNKVYWR